MIQIYFEKNAIHEEFDGDYYQYDISVKIVRTKNYTKVVLYDFSYIGYKEYYSNEHDKDGQHKKYKKYENGIEYKKKMEFRKN
ncbi:MAG: hypothetical protein EU548_03565 [Promethearchaeota archaeon]|nr:MAG: hypothetical protein EU548_03565 [Candidatus Lokiarchaeota archaeon]